MVVQQAGDRQLVAITSILDKFRRRGFQLGSFEHALIEGSILPVINNDL